MKSKQNINNNHIKNKQTKNEKKGKSQIPTQTTVGRKIVSTYTCTYTYVYIMYMHICLYACDFQTCQRDRYQGLVLERRNHNKKQI